MIEPWPDKDCNEDVDTGSYDPLVGAKLSALLLWIFSPLSKTDGTRTRYIQRVRSNLNLNIMAWDKNIC